MLWSGLKNIRSFFTVYNDYRNLSSFFSYLRKESVCDVGYHTVADLKAVYILDGIAYLTSCHTFCIQRNYLLLNAGDVLLTLFYDLWLKCPVMILRHFDLSFAQISTYLLCFLAVAVIGVI